VAAVRRAFEQSGIWDDFEAVERRMEDAVRRGDREALQQAVRDNHRLLATIGVVPEKVRSFVDEVEKAGGAAKVCGAGAVAGDAAGVMMVVADRPPRDLCARFGFTLEPVRGEPLGVRIV
jgi:mevalonate kinase